MIYAQITNGIVQNVIVLDNTSLISVFANGYDYFVDITDVSPQPGIGWSYNGSAFTNPNSGGS